MAMRLRKKAIVGRINSQGEIQAPWSVLYDFASMHKGDSVAIRCEILPKTPSDKVKAYYFGYILSEIQQALWQTYGERFTKEETDEWIRKQCPLCIEETRDKGKWKVRVKEFEDLDPCEANELIEWLFQFSIENLNLVLDDAR